MRHRFDVRIGPVGFRIGSAWRQPVALLERLYADYPKPQDGIPDFTVRLEPERPWRRFVRPSVAIHGDFTLPDASPLPLAQGLLAAEMGMNLQMALGQRRYLLLHASAVERDGRALLMTGQSGAGKSTLAAMLGERGWRFMGDEFALLDPETGLLHAFPRLVSLKNRAITAMEAEAEAEVEEARFGPRLTGTPKGDIRHLRPNAAALAAMDATASPAMILFPRYGFDPAQRDVGASEAFVRLTQASTNYVAMGEPAFDALSALVTSVPGIAIDYPDTESAVAQVEGLWR